ncbi:hypothetical protein CEXT_71721 [Caerostris extrusa]|uniref:Uncharacterized protein n=1 Tax=Caerostris extrusa TaxID=172846 RepID=A0AAV4T609_CAEEX|nr:hypothetical protein CEXT_71721 [Caerostris extrusa]
MPSSLFLDHLYETENPNNFTGRAFLRLLSTSQVSVQNRESREAKLCAMKLNKDKNTQGNDFSHGIADSVSYALGSIQTQKSNFGSGIINSNIEPRAWEYSNPVTYSSLTYNACNISTTTTSKKSTVDCNEHTPDKMSNRNPSLFKQSMDKFFLLGN